MAQNEFRNALQAMSNSAASTVSAPVDGIAWLLRKAGVNIPGNALGGSDWMAQQGLTAPVRPGASQIAGDTLGLLAPMVAAAKAPQIARGLLAVERNALAPSVVNRGGAAGQRGIFMGDMSKTWDKGAAAKAQAMEQAGADARAIWQETGTFKGVDGKWRQEIDDSAAGIRLDKPMFGESVETAAMQKLPVYLDHKQAYKAYPDTKNINTSWTDAEAGAAYFAPRTYAEYIDLPLHATKESKRSSALHELQHAIQQRQGFAPGGMPSASDFSDPLLSLDPVEKVIEAGKSVPYKQFKEAFNTDRSPYGRYKRLAGEVEARAVQSRMNLTPAERRALFPFDSYDVPMNSLIVK